MNLLSLLVCCQLLIAVTGLDPEELEEAIWVGKTRTDCRLSSIMRLYGQNPLVCNASCSLCQRELDKWEGILCANFLATRGPYLTFWVVWCRKCCMWHLQYKVISKRKFKDASKRVVYN